MLIRLFFDAGHSWNSLYFFDVSRETVDKIKDAFKQDVSSCCWQGVTLSDDEKILEITVDFCCNVQFSCVENTDVVTKQWHESAFRMNRSFISMSYEDNVRAIKNSVLESKIKCCMQNLKMGKCKNNFVFNNVGRFLLPRLYLDAKQK